MEVQKVKLNDFITKSLWLCNKNDDFSNKIADIILKRDITINLVFNINGDDYPFVDIIECIYKEMQENIDLQIKQRMQDDVFCEFYKIEKNIQNLKEELVYKIRKILPEINLEDD